MKISLIFLILLTIGFVKVQAQDCNCKEVLEEVIVKVSDNYIQLKQIQLAGKAITYEQRVADYRKKVEGVPANKCSEFLHDFLRYFKDGHLFVFEYPKYTESQLAKHKAQIQSQKKTAEQLLQILQQQQGKNALIGRWTDGVAELIMVEENGKFNAYILKYPKDASKNGEVLARFERNKYGLKARYNTYKYTPRYAWGEVYKEGTMLSMSGGIAWAKITSDQSMLIQPKLPTIKKLDEKNTLFTIPSFSVSYKDFVQLVKTNKRLLLNSTNLIFDIRGNTGGNAVYFSFLKMYANQTLKDGQGLVLASEATKAYFSRFAKRAGKIYKPVVTRITENMGKIVEGPKYPDRKFKPLKKSKIKNVAILTDGGCMSAAESFILHSKGASSKVTTFGSPTRGVIDYTSVSVLKLASGNQRIYFGYPTSTLHKEIPKNGYNKNGIAPDVPIATNVKNKVDFIVQYFNKK